MTDNFNSELNFQATDFNNAPPQQPAPVFDAFSGQPQQGYPPQQGYVSFDQTTPPQPQYVNYDQTQPQPAWVPQAQPQQVDYSQFDAQGQPQQQFGGEEHHHHEQQQQQQQQPPGPPRHFVACFLMVAFKIAAVLCNFFISSDAVTAEFIAVLSLSAVDFWVTKNICGRLLVGLRWWNEVKDDGTNEWIFESLEGKRQIHQTEALLFWGALGGNTILWIVLCIVHIISFKFEYLIESVLVTVMSLVNLIGYFKCARDASKRVKSMATSFMVSSAIDYATAKN